MLAIRKSVRQLTNLISGSGVVRRCSARDDAQPSEAAAPCTEKIHIWEAYCGTGREAFGYGCEHSSNFFTMNFYLVLSIYSFLGTKMQTSARHIGQPPLPDDSELPVLQQLLAMQQQKKSEGAAGPAEGAAGPTEGVGAVAAGGGTAEGTGAGSL